MIDFYTEYSGAMIISALLLPIIVSAFHYLIVGDKGVRLSASDNVIQRFSLSERIYHFIRMVSFIFVAGTGVYFIFNVGSRNLGMVHSINGSIFLLISIITLFIWFKHGLFKDYDGLWLKQMGGYLSKDERTVPAGKFNAGQKIFFWLSVLFPIILAATGVNLTRAEMTQTQANGTLLVIHGITAALAIISVIGHVYLSLWVNKGTWRVLTNGKVSEEWAQCHHPNWKTAIPSKN